MGVKYHIADEETTLILHGGCLEIFGAIRPAEEFVITSPPFGRTLRQGGTKLEGKSDGVITALSTQIEANSYEIRNSLAK
jgi:hypothetical protein